MFIITNLTIPVRIKNIFFKNTWAWDTLSTLFVLFSIFISFANMVRYDFRLKTMLVRLYLQLYVEGLMSYLRYSCLLAYSVVQHICVVFLCCLSLVLCLVYPILPFSLNYLFFIHPSVFSNMYVLNLIFIIVVKLGVSVQHCTDIADSNAVTSEWTK